MNIFILDNDPVIAAQEQCDKHVVKMIVESARMLSTVHRMLDGVMERRPSKSGAMLQYWKLNDQRENILYKACHFNALCDEYTYRYGKVHSTDTKLREILKSLPNKIKIGKTPFKLAKGSNPECVVTGLGGTDAVESYRNFYQTKQKRFSMVWTKRETPKWFNAI